MQATDPEGATGLDVVTVTVADAPPSGAVILSSVQPGPTPMSEGSPVSFTVQGVGYSDPASAPSIWADWNGTGNFDLVSQFTVAFSGANGNQTAKFTHIYDDMGTYSAAFRVEDAEGNYTPSGMSVPIANVAPTADFAIEGGSTAVQPGQPISFEFSNVFSPSQAVTEAGFTYSYELDNGDYQSSTASDYVIPSLPAGSSHTLNAYLTDKNGSSTPVTSVSFNVLSDRLVSFSGSGSAQLNWTNSTNGSSGTTTLQGTQTYQFVQEITGLTATLLTANTTYNLSTNYVFDSVTANVPVTSVEVHTDLAVGSLGFVEDGHVGLVTVAAGGTVTVGSRGDFGGLSAATSYAASLTFGNQAGPIVADHAGQIIASGTISGITLAQGVGRISGYSVKNVLSNTKFWLSSPALVLTVGPGGQLFNRGDFGVEQVSRYLVDANGRTTEFRSNLFDQNTIISYAYAADGMIRQVGDHYGTILFGRDANHLPVQIGGNRSAPAGVALGQPLPPAVTEPAPGLLDVIWEGAVQVVNDTADGVTALANEVTQTIQTVKQTVFAVADEVWTEAGNTIAWAVDTAGKAALYIGDQVVQCTQQIAEQFVKTLTALGGSIGKLVAIVDKFVGSATALMTALVDNPTLTLTRLGDSLGKGLNDFFNGLDKTLPNALLDWAKQGLTLPTTPLPTDWTKAAVVGPWLLDLFNLNWDSVQGLLVQTLGASNAGLITEAFNTLQTSIAENDSSGVFGWLSTEAEKMTPQQLMDQVVAAGVQYVTQSVAPKIAATIAAKFTPGAGVISTLYNTLTWVVNQLDAFAGMAKLATDIATQLGPVVNGDANAAKTLSNTVKKFLDGTIPIALNFGASQLNLATLPQDVGAVIMKVQTYPLGKVQAAIGSLGGKIKTTLGLGGQNGLSEGATQGLIGTIINSTSAAKRTTCSKKT